MVESKKKLDAAKFTIGELVKHRYYPFRGVIFDVDPEFMNSEEWYDSIPKDIRPKRNQNSTKSIMGGLLVQDNDDSEEKTENWISVTNKNPSNKINLDLNSSDNWDPF